MIGFLNHKKKLLKRTDILVADIFQNSFVVLPKKMLQSLKSKIVNIIKRINTKYSKRKANSIRNEGTHKHTHTEDLVSLTTLVTTNANLIQLKAKVVKKLG